ncbi:hypothetical protein C0J52_08788 [Blattella germanica]|nr:hypothetical protein C0J52_08788 [Blattella germanica]
MPGSMNSGPSTPDSESKKATVEAHAYIPLANGKRERESESPDNSDPPAGEMDPCLPANNKLQQAHDEIDHAPIKKSKLHNSNNSLSRMRRSLAAEESSRRPNFIENVEEKLKEKTGLSRLGLIIAAVVLFLLLVFLLVTIVLGSTWPITPHSHLFPVCTRAACLQASAQVSLSFIKF